MSSMDEYGPVVDKSEQKAQIRDVLIRHMFENDLLNDDAL